MSAYNDRETLSTLRFGNRAKSIKNAVKQNAQRSAKELIGLLAVAEEKIAKTTQLIEMIQKYIGLCIREDPINREKLKIVQMTKDFEVLHTLLNQGAEACSRITEEE